MLFDKVNQLFRELKTCPENAIQNYFTPIIELYPILSPEEKKTITYDFYEWATQNGETVKLGYAKYVLALYHFFNGEYHDALVSGNDANESFELTNNKDAAALCLSLFGSIYRALGDLSHGLKLLQQSREQLKQSGAYTHNQMACDYQIASIYLEMGHPEDALPLYHSVLEMAEKLDNKIWIVNALLGSGKAFIAQKNYGEAFVFLEKGTAFAQMIQNPGIIATSLTDLANYYIEVNDDAAAEKLHQQALELRQQQNYITGVVTNGIHIAEIYIRQQKIAEAITVLETNLKLAEQIRVNPKVYKIHQMLSSIYEQKGDVEKSLVQYKLYHTIRAEVESEDNARKLKNVQLLLEAEQTLKENVIIKEQKKQIESKNIELQETIDELTRTKVGKRAKAYTLVIAIILFMIEEMFLHYVLHLMGDGDFYLSLVVKMVIIFLLKPIDSAIEHFLLKKIIKKQPKVVLV